MKIIGIMLVMAWMVCLFGCTQTTQAPAQTQAEATTQQTVQPTSEITAQPASKILTVYFSRTGNTAGIAEYISAQTGADLFEIVPQTPYPDDYQECLALASEELAADARPEIAASVENMADYDVVFVGFPIWHGNTPMIVRTFLEAYDLAGKTVIPFATSGSSGMEEAQRAVSDLCPDADVQNGLCIPSSQMESAQQLTDEWLSGLTLSK